MLIFVLQCLGNGGPTTTRSCSQRSSLVTTFVHSNLLYYQQLVWISEIGFFYSKIYISSIEDEVL